MTGVSIIVPCRDAGAWIAQTLRSALAQTLPPREILVVDDASTDRSAEIAEGFGPPVRVIRACGRGACAARRQGAREAQGQFLMFLDADDLLAPDTLAALVETLEAAPQPSVALCPWDRYEAAGGIWLARPPTNRPAAPWADPLSAWLREAWSPPCAVLWTRESYDRAGGWDPAIRFDQDGELMRRAFARGVRALRTPAGLALYRRLPGSLSSRRDGAEGAEAAVAVLEGLARELVAAGGIDRHRPALVAAADAAARRPGADARLRARAGALVARCGGRRATDRIRTRLHAGAARMATAWVPRFAPAAPEPAAPPPGRSGGRVDASPCVSVVIPTHERPALTVAAVRSALSQTWPNLEVIVVDDASSDETPDRVREIADPRLRLIVQPENRGVAAARNAGMAAARGEMIAFLDSDDLWRPEKIARQAAALGAAPARVGICQCGSEMALAGGGTFLHRPEAEGRLFGPLLHRNVLHGGGSTVMIRRAVVEAIGGFDEDLPAIEDWDFFQRAARLFDVACVPEPLAVIRDDAPGPRRSTRFRANMAARATLFARNRHALRRARKAHLFLVDSAVRELAAPEGSRRRSLRLACRALAERPFATVGWRQLRYSLLPWGLRSLARAGLARLRGPRPARAADIPANR